VYIRYIINGIVATAFHYAILYLAIEVVDLHSAGVSNLLASIVGISASFLGNRYFVFKSTQSSIYSQAITFLGFYAAIALIHGGVLYLWTDRLGLNYNIGFLIAVLIQTILGFIAGNRYVFKN